MREAGVQALENAVLHVAPTPHLPVGVVHQVQWVHLGQEYWASQHISGDPLGNLKWQWAGLILGLAIPIPVPS